MKSDTTTRPRGRPRKPLTQGARPVVTLRFSADQRAQLEREADRNGWSLAQEAVARIDRTFLEDSVLGGSDTAVLLRLLAGVIQSIEARTRKSWRDDYLTATAVNAAVNSAIRALSPTPPDDEITRYATADVLDRQNMGDLDPDLAAQVRDYEAALQRAYELGSSLAQGSLAVAHGPATVKR